MLGKRLFDILFSSAALLFGAPLYLAIILLVKCTSKGPVFFHSLRMGKEGVPFTCWKFRTMCIDAQSRLDALLQSNPTLREEWKTYHKLRDDPRLTPVGKFLRATSLDELPQFWNVLIGDLSVVGPRPIDVSSRETGYAEIAKRYGKKTDKILSVKPGITCLWQVNGRNELTFKERATLEEKYVDSRSFWLDLRVIVKTLRVLIFPKGAY